MDQTGGIEQGSHRLPEYSNRALTGCQSIRIVLRQAARVFE